MFTTKYDKLGFYWNTKENLYMIVDSNVGINHDDLIINDKKNIKGFMYTMRKIVYR